MMPAKDSKQFDKSWVRDRRLTLDEILLYRLEVNLPPCLVCGRKLRTLSGHLTTHDMSISEYRDFYGIPRFMKISDSESRALYAEMARDKHKTGAFGFGDDRDAALAHSKAMRAIKRNPNRPEIFSLHAISNCGLINRGCSGRATRLRKLSSTHTKEQTGNIMRETAIRNGSHVRVLLANEKNGWKKTPEHEARRVEVLGMRAEIVRNTPEHLLNEALIQFKAQCRAERNRRIVAKRKAAKDFIKQLKEAEAG